MIARALEEVLYRNQTLTATSERLRIKLPDSRDQSFAIANLYGVLRYFFSFEQLLESLIEKPLKKKDNDLKCLLLAGLYQIYFMNVPIYATVSENVEATKTLKKPWASKLINAILRNSERLKVKFSTNHFGTTNLEHPLWYTRKCQIDWPTKWFSILRANNQHPPLTIRVNPKFMSRDNYSKLLASKGFDSIKTQLATNGLKLKKPTNPRCLPFFQEGAFSVQDEAAQLPVEALELENARNVLDICAAPGGKTTQILELSQPKTEITAIDNHPERLQRLRNNLSRLKFDCKVLQGDAKRKASWWKDGKFDRILVDAPCSASGVVRRHPDIKIRRKKEELEALCDLQLRILEESWTLLEKNGILVYATCSIFHDENEHVIKKFIENKKESIIYPPKKNWELSLDYGNQILPGKSDMDGFYFCRLLKQ